MGVYRVAGKRQAGNGNEEAGIRPCWQGKRRLKQGANTVLKQKNGDSETGECAARTTCVARADCRAFEFAALQALIEFIRQTVKIAGLVAQHIQWTLASPASIHVARG